MKNAALVSFLLAFAAQGFSQNADIDLLRHINLDRNKNLDRTFLFITNTASPVSFALPLGIIGAGLVMKDKTVTTKGIVAAASIITAVSLSTAMKYTFRRPRPFTTYPDLEKLTDGGGFSFPSGHTTTAFAAATSVSLAFPRWYVIAPAALWACAVGYSRMHLGVHYPSDVLMGMILGAGSSFFCWKAQKWVTD